MRTRHEQRTTDNPRRLRGEKCLRVAFAHGYGTPEEDVDHPLAQGGLEERNLYRDVFANASRGRKSDIRYYDIISIFITDNKISDECDIEITQELDLAARALKMGLNYQTHDDTRRWATVTAINVRKHNYIYGDQVDSTAEWVQPGPVKERAPKQEPQEGVPHEEQVINLEEVFFARGPEVAEGLFIRLAAEMGARFPKRKESLKSKAVNALDSGRIDVEERASSKRAKEVKLNEASPAAEKSVQRPREIKLPPRTGHPLIEKFASLWDERKSLPRRDFVQRFQGLLDEFHDRGSLDSLEQNQDACSCVKLIAKGSFIKLKYMNMAVTIECLNQGDKGYFRCNYAHGKGRAVPGTGSDKFPKLSLISLVD